MNSQDFLTTDPVKGRKLLGSFIIALVIVISVVAITLGIIQGVKKPVAYVCIVDTDVLGPQVEDLCQFVPEGIRLRSDVLVTGGMAEYPGVIKIEGDDTVYYNLLPFSQQIGTLVKTPRFFENSGFYGGLLGGIALVLVFIGIFSIAKKLMQKREKSLLQQEQLHKLMPIDDSGEEGFELNFNSI